MSRWQRLGAMIRRLRGAQGMTQAQLATKTALSLVFIKKVERGARMPSWPSLEAIARALGTAVDVTLRPRRSRRRR